MAGYKGYSMSNNAVEAYINGERPLSKWNKKAVIEYIAEDLGVSTEEVQLKYNYDYYLTKKSYHHTSCKYNKTDFYTVWYEEKDLIINADVKKRQQLRQVEEWLGNDLKKLEEFKSINIDDFTFEIDGEEIKVVGPKAYLLRCRRYANKDIDFIKQQIKLYIDNEIAIIEKGINNLKTSIELIKAGKF